MLKVHPMTHSHTTSL